MKISEMIQLLSNRKKLSIIIVVFVLSFACVALLGSLQSVLMLIGVVLIFIGVFILVVQNISLRIEKKLLSDYEKKLKESEVLFKAVFEQATVGIAIVHNDKYITAVSENIPTVNPMFEKIVGRSKYELDNISWTDITHPDDLQHDLENFEKFKAGEIKGYELEKRYIKPDGSFVWVRMIVSPLHFDNAPYTNHLCVIEDISERMEMEKNLYESERSKAAILYNLPGMAYRCSYDRDWTMQFVSEGCSKLTGYKPESLLYNKDVSFKTLIHPKYREYIWHEWGESIRQKSKFRDEYELITASGEKKWVFEQGIGIYDLNGNVTALEGLIIDITERKKQEIRLKYINYHDELTGLYNRRYFNEFIEAELKGDRKEKSSVILVNLKKFGVVNLTLGYTFAEKMIKELAENLSAVCNEECKLFHVSRDTFVFYLNSYKNKDELIKFNDFIVGIINATFVSKTIGASIGILELENSECDAERILKNGLIAAQYVNEYQHLGYAFFDLKMEEKLLREARIKNELDLAVLNTGDTLFYLEYQPVINMKTNKVHSFEALSRLKSSKLGNVSPSEFIPIAEDTQLIVPLGKLIMKQALLFLKKLGDEGYHDVKVALNISTIQLLRDDFIPELVDTIDETAVNANRIILEITESLFFNNYQEINDKIDALKLLGIEIAIDDFGTGYSSLARERELNVNCLKIDKYFIDKLLLFDENESITADIISMAHKIGHYVIAEGVEHEKQKNYLLESGCDLLQGYLFSRPVPEKAAIEFLKKF